MAKETGAAVASIAQAIQLKIQSAASMAGTNQKIAFIGPSGHGKTSAALSASRYAPASWPAKEFTQLSDGFLIVVDTGGHDVVKSLNVDVPMYYMGELYDAAELIATYKQVVQLVRQRIIAGETTFVVLDSFSEFAERVCRKLVAANPGCPEKEYNNRIWTPLATKMGEVFAEAASLPCDVFFVCHVRDKGQDKDGKRFAAQVAGGANIEMDVTGKALQMLRRNTSCIIPVLRQQMGKDSYEYAFYPNGTMGIEAKSRYRLLDKEPANARLLLEKIRSQQPVG